VLWGKLFEFVKKLEQKIWLTPLEIFIGLANDEIITFKVVFLCCLPINELCSEVIFFKFAIQFWAECLALSTWILYWFRLWRNDNMPEVFLCYLPISMLCSSEVLFWLCKNKFKQNFGWFSYWFSSWWNINMPGVILMVSTFEYSTMVGFFVTT